VDFVAITTAFLASLLAAIIFMSGVFIIGRHLRRFDIVDVAWGLVFIVVTIVPLLMNDEVHLLQWVVFGLVVIWGLRLSSHIYRRFRATTSEDKRYVAMRKKWQSGNENIAIYFRIYIIQAVLATIVCLPVLLVSTADIDALSPIMILGLIIWLIGFSIEAVADRQLRQFIAEPSNKGQLMTRGLWRYSRHPNYFGELMLWWGLGVIALGVPYGWIGLVGPIVISYLIVFVSGIPPTEKAFAGRAGWAEYKHRTSVLVPWFVR
jgi:steroid 5-alpha reductase family enzyme